MDKDHAYAIAFGANFQTPQIPGGPTPARPAPPAPNGKSGKGKDKRGARPPGW